MSLNYQPFKKDLYPREPSLHGFLEDAVKGQILAYVFYAIERVRQINWFGRYDDDGTEPMFTYSPYFDREVIQNNDIIKKPYVYVGIFSCPKDTPGFDDIPSDFVEVDMRFYE